MNDNDFDEQLCKRLDAISQYYKLGDMYRGAILVLESSNPDRCAQAANSLRELLEKLVHIATGEPARDTGIFTSKRKDMEKLLLKYRKNRVPDTLEKLLNNLDEYLELNNKPDTESKLTKAMGVGHGVIPEVQQEKVTDIVKIHRKLNKYVHHQGSPTPDNIKKKIGELRWEFNSIINNIQGVNQKEIEIQKEIKEILGHDE